jgi:hypothetical protein
MRLSRRFLQILLGLALISSVHAQVDTATITGRVSDSTGASIANAQVRVVQKETNFQFAAVTNSEGIYRVQSLQPGTYQVTMEAAGFKRLVQDGITLRVGDVLPVNGELQIGAVTESVEVTAHSTLLETETSASGTVTEGDTLYKTAMYQRYVTNAMTIVPGLTTQTTGGTNGLSAFNVNGQRNTGTAFFEDGMFGVDPLASQLLTIKPILNSVEEVKVLTGTLPAEYGHSTSGVLTTVKKSGTNELHGSASDFGRTRRMTHRQFFNLFTTAQPQPGNPNGVPAWFMQPDANVGGPIVIPKVYNGRNKTFFFFGYNKLIEKKTQAYTSQTPTPDMLRGDFTFGGLGQPLYDPLTTRQNPDGTWTRDPFPTRIIPQSRFDPVASKVLSYNIWRPPNMPGSFSSTGPVSNFTYNPPSRTFFEDYSGRVDQQFSDKFKMYASYTYNHENGLERPTNIQVAAFDATTGNNGPGTQQNVNVGATYVFNPTTLNEARISFLRPRSDLFVPSFNQNWAATLGIPNDSPALMPAFGANGLGVGTYTTAPGYAQMYGLTTASPGGPTSNIRQSYSLRDDFSKIHGSHAFKMGYEMLYFTANYFQLGQPSGVFQFDNMTAGLQPNGQPVPNTGNTFAGFELGAVRQANFTTYTTTWLPQDSINSLYFQDDWKFSKTLTFNLGLRWSTESPFHTAHGLESNFSPTTVDPLTGKMGAVIHPTGGLNNRDWKNFQPRIGLAWHPLNKWVFRGGFGINTVDIRFPNALQNFDEYQALVVQQRAPGDPRPLFQLSQGPAPVVYNVLPNQSAAYVGTNYGSRNAFWMDPNLHPGYVMNWNATAEYQVSANALVKLIYQGSAGVHLVETWNINAFPPDFGAGNPALQNAVFAAAQNYLPYPQFGAIDNMSNTGHSSFHAGTVQYQKRYSQGLVVDGFYTFSKALDDCDTDYGLCTGVEPVTNRNLAKGRAGYDMNHRFVVSANYELPVGKGRHFMNRGGILNVLFGGYEISWIQTVESGNPFGFSFTNSPNNYYPTAGPTPSLTSGVNIGTYVPNLVATPTMQQFGLGNLIGGNRFNQALENPVVNVADFAAPPAFTPGNAGRNILTGPGSLYSQISAKKNFKFGERWNLQVRWDFQNPFHNYGFSAPSSQLDFKNPNLFGKITSDVATASLNGEPLMNLMLRLSW